MFAAYGILGIAIEVTAIVHFVRSRNPNWIWLWVIIGLGPLGGIVYLVAEVVPTLQLAHTPFRSLSRKKRIRQLHAVVEDNPAPGNWEELADLYREAGAWEQARECFSHAITPRTVVPSPFYGRAQCAVKLNDYQAAVPDLETTVRFERTYDFHRALGLLAHCYGKLGRAPEAEKLFREALSASVLSETQFNFACFLADQGRTAEARQWAETILKKRATIPKYLRRVEVPWFRRAEALRKALPA